MQVLEIMVKTGFTDVLLGGLVVESPDILLGLASNLEKLLWEERRNRAATRTREAGAGCQDVAI